MTDPHENLVDPQVTEDTLAEVLEQNDTEEQTEATEEVEATTVQTSNLAEQLAELKDKYLRQMADFDNFKRRTAKERLEMAQTAGRETMIALLPVIDDFERAKRASEVPGCTEPFSEGINMVYNKLTATLQSRGLKRMESTGADFDPDQHEAIVEIPAPTEDLKGKVIDTVEGGYLLGDKIIKHAKVVIGK